MTQNKKSAWLIVAAFAACLVVVPAHAQVTSAPIVIKSNSTPSTKPIKTRFEVLRMMINAIQVRSLTDEKEIHTFLYSDQIRDEMQNMFNNGGYQYGDRVVIRYVPGTSVALRIKGKPSKPV